MTAPILHHPPRAPAALARVRVIVTGSRYWTDAAIVRRILSTLPPGSTVVHGGARGLDTIADNVALGMGLSVERHTAPWSEFGKAAGTARNQWMADAGADRCYAFPLPGSVGTWDMVNRAKAAGIPTQIVGVDGEVRDA